MKKSLGGIGMCVLLMACGDDGGPLTVDFGLPRSMEARDATDEQWVRQCVAYYRFEDEHDEIERDLCVIIGAFDETSESCEDRTRTCLDRVLEPEAQTPEERCADSTVPEAYETCDVTIGDLEDCTNDRIVANERIVAELDCSYAGDRPRLDELLARHAPASCDELTRRCPDLL